MNIKEKTDLEKFLALYKSVGIDVVVIKDDDGSHIDLEAKTHEKLIGYEGFTTSIHFDELGKFSHQTVWE